MRSHAKTTAIAAMLVAGLKLACVVGEEERTGTVTSPLAAEPPDPEDPPEPGEPPGTGSPCTNASVVSIQDHNGVSIASAVVLSPELLLTAGHLVLTQQGQVDNPEASKLSVAKGPTACAHGPSTITGVLKHPNFAWGTETDLAVIKISPPLTGATAVTFANAPSVGTLVTLTAYGVTGSSGGSGVERCTNGTVDWLGSQGAVDVDFGTGQACQGDSGGAIFERGSSRLVGILWGGLGTNVQCSSTGRVGTDLQFARNAVTNPPTFAPVTCTPQTYTPCLREGQTCPSSASLYCQFDERHCSQNGTRGTCQARSTTTPTCLTGTVWNQSTCACVTAPSGGGSSGSGGGWYPPNPGGGGSNCFDVFASDVCYWGGTGTASICLDGWGFWYTEYDFIDCYAG